MKKDWLCFVGILTVLGVGRAAEVPAQSRDPRTALVFSLSGLGDFGIGGVPFGVNIPLGTSDANPLTGLGLKTFLSDRLAVRGLLHLGWTSLDEGKTQTYIVGLAPGLEYHWVKTKTIHAYIGAAAAFGISRSTQTGFSGGEGGGDRDTKYSGNVIGVSGLLGVEVFAFKNLSLGAEYQLRGTATSGKMEYGSVSSDLPKNFSIGLGTVAAMLAVYW